MWGIETTAWLQWGANMNSVMERNIGQSLGVGAVFDAESYAATSRLDNLNVLEHLVYKLTPPEWPAEVFGQVDEAKATRGHDVYDRQCANCHEKPFAVTPSGLIVYQLFTLKETGVSPLVATNFDETVLVDGKPVRFAAAAFTVLESLKQRYYTANRISDQMQAEWEGRTRRPPPQWKPTMRSTLADADKYPDTRGGRVLPAKPLAGIWATAPYLNNGSVASIWDLLTPPEIRPATFALGTREYDTKSLGYRSTPAAVSRRRCGCSIRADRQFERRSRLRHEPAGRRQVGAHRVFEDAQAGRLHVGPNQLTGWWLVVLERTNHSQVAPQDRVGSS